MADLSQLSDADLLTLSKQQALADIPTEHLEAAAAPPPATAMDRLQAGEGGFLRGAAYLGALPADTLVNAVNLGRAGIGTAYQAASGRPPPGWLDVQAGASPVGAALTRLMDKSPITTTQPTRPDDPASRYLAASASVVPGVLAGGGSVPQAMRALTATVPGAIAAQYVGEKQPFQSEAANNAAAILAQALTTRAAGSLTRGPGVLLPQNAPKNQVVMTGQKAGYKFPPATINPTAGNRALESIAGKVATQQHASINNQRVTNEGFREDLKLPTGQGGSVTDLEIATAKANAAPGYDALRSAGQIQVTPTFAQRLSAALTKSQGASRLSPKLGSSELEGIVGDLKKQQSFDAGDAMDAMAMLRDKASEAYRAGNSTTGAGFRAASKALEDAIDQHLSSQGGAAADLLSNYRDSRRQFAQIGSYEDARNPLTGNVNATKLAAALKNKEPLSGRSLLAAQAAGHAPKAFAEPSSSPASHLSAWGALGAGLLAAHEYLPGHAGLAGALGAAAVPLTRMGARAYVLGPGQKNVLPRSPAPWAPGVLPGALTAGASTLGQTP